MEITFLGHSSLLLEINNKRILVDPFISGNPLASEINIQKLKADFILVTHAHQDHVLDVEDIGKANDALIVSNYEITTYFANKGLRVHGMNFGGKHKFDFGYVKYVSALHSSTFADGTYGGNPGGFVVWNETNCIYISGDTGLTLDMKLIPKTCPKLDLAILCIGDNFTMGYEDALIASQYIECDNIMGYHYNSFPAIMIDQNKAQAYFKEQGNKNLILPNIGEKLSL